MKDPLEVLSYVSAEALNDENIFNEAKMISIKILDLLGVEEIKYTKGSVYLAIYIVVTALVDVEISIQRRSDIPH